MSRRVRIARRMGPSRGHSLDRHARSGALALALLGLLATAFLGTGALASAPGARAASSCSHATAKKLINKHHWNAFLLDDPVAQYFCGPFTGKGSRAMVVGVAAATCWSPQQWAVFDKRSSGWKVALHRNEWVYPLEVVGGDKIRATSPVHGPTDEARCIFTGGTKSRTWEWKRGGFEHGKWSYQKPSFLSPDKKVWCQIDARTSATYCNTFDAHHSGYVEFGGKTTICNSTQGCLPNFDSSAPVLDYGKKAEMNGFTCKSETSGITCTDDSSGKGFRINKSLAVAVG